MTIPINHVIPSHRRSMDAKKWFVVVYKFMHGANKELPIVYVLLKKLPRNNILLVEVQLKSYRTFGQQRSNYIFP